MVDILYRDILYRDILCWIFSIGLSCGGYTLQGYLVVNILYRDIFVVDILYWDILWWIYSIGISCVGYTLLQEYLVVDIHYSNYYSNYKKCQK